MAVKAKKVEVWAADLEDQPGGLARVLSAMADAGASLECVIARRKPDRPGAGVVFLAPVKGKKAEAAAANAGLRRAQDMGTLRVEGDDKPGLGGRMTQAVADAGINMKGVSAMTVGKKFIAYFGFDRPEDADQAAAALKKVSTKKTKR